MWNIVRSSRPGFIILILAITSSTLIPTASTLLDETKTKHQHNLFQHDTYGLSRRHNDVLSSNSLFNTDGIRNGLEPFSRQKKEAKAQTIMTAPRNISSVSWKKIQKRKRGSIAFNFGRQSSRRGHTNTNHPVIHHRQKSTHRYSTHDMMKRRADNSHQNYNLQTFHENNGSNENLEQGMVLTIDCSSAIRLLSIFLGGSGATLSAFMGTLRLLAPLIVSRRVLVGMWAILTDYLTGRYYRKAYSRVQRVYLRYYELPAAARAFCRVGSQVAFLWFILSSILGWLVGISHPPCRSDGRGLALFCGMLWVGAVVGTGQAFSMALARWGGPLRIQAAIDPFHRSRRSRVTDVFTQPYHILQWMQEPDRWIKLVNLTRSVKAFDPNPIIFPATWVPLRLLQICAIAKILSTEPCDYKWKSWRNLDITPRLMKCFLIQTALGDEWYRVFIGERRIGLGIPIITTYFLALIALIIQCAMIDVYAAVLFLPSVVAGILSGWMNIAIFWNRLEDKKKEATLSALSFTKKQEEVPRTYSMF